MSGTSNIDDCLANCPYVEHGELFKIRHDNAIFNILHLNIRSLVKNLHELRVLLDEFEQEKIRIDVICLCETYLTDTK